MFLLVNQDIFYFHLDKGLINRLNETGADFEGNVSVVLKYLPIPKCRKLSLTGFKKREELNRGSLRNYFFALPTTPSVPLVQDVSLFDEENQMIKVVVEFRTVAGKD